MSSLRDNGFDWDAIRAKLNGAKGRDYWRSLDELADTPEFREMAEREFPRDALRVNRRDFLKLAGASLALAGLAGCRQVPREKIVPYVTAPEDMVPGKPVMYATAFPHRGSAIGVLAVSHEGRPTKIEGNPDHPSSLGATDAITQASLLGLYDPDRSQTVRFKGEESTWDAFLAAMAGEMQRHAADGGAGIRILTETVLSPTLAAQIQSLQAKYPNAKWHQWDSVNRDNERAGAIMSFGQDVHPVYRFDQADVVLSLDADFLMSMPGSVRYARDFASKRRVRKNKAEMNRLYVVESTPTVTGAMADHRLAMKPSEVADLAGRTVGLGSERPPLDIIVPMPEALDRAISDMCGNRGRSLVVAGEAQPASVHAAAHGLNADLGNVGKTVYYTQPVEASPVDQMASLKDLTADIQAGRVQMLVILGANPVFTALADLDFAKQLEKVPLRVHLGLYNDETAYYCHWHVPETHYLEAWSDTRAHDGTASVIQPLILPLFGGRSSHEVMAALLGKPQGGYDIVHGYWQARRPSADFETDFRQILNKGVIEGTAFPPKTVSAKQRWPAARKTEKGIELAFRPDPTVWDGRYANNGWLQELPRPITKLTWDNAAIISPKLSKKLGVGVEARHADIVEITLKGRKIKAPVWVLPGQPDDTVTLHFGQGRTRGGKASDGAGFDAYPLRTSDALWSGTGVQIRKTGETVILVSTQDHQSLTGQEDEQGRELVVAGTISQYKKNPRLTEDDEETQNPKDSLFDAPEDFVKYDGYNWGMTIDLNTCIGCGACVTACQAENNIPVVGKDQVARGRQMHWIRVDRYYKGGLENPKTVHQPVPCMQCEKAPCEPVCPVGATVHSHEGINQQVYNRCVGTRYCSNNCPYKVRRFNFYKYSAAQPHSAPGNYDQPTLQLMANPDVTVRGRGVMEKCTYCVQRINAARIEAKVQGRPIKDGEIKTACQQACPTGAIVFGDIANPKSEVSLLKAEPANYSLLGSLNTIPRTTYLAKVTNPNPEIGEEG